MRLVRLEPSDRWGQEPRWLTRCDRCLERERLERAELARLEALWVARECAAPDCSVVFVPSVPKQRFHDDRCRKRTHHRQKAQRVA